ncbi:putative aldouronate transport system substrate-binding protein [Paenibacillaceae bacterium GAS479]|nr:putative aldouronate transport system substrate-binding protein [Paenibacillaceae bacterium GAS479]
MIVSKKTSSAILLLLLGGMMLLSACSSKEGTSSGGKSDGQETRGKITSTIYDRGGVAPEEGTMISNRWSKWIKENSPVDVSFVSVPRWESAQKLNTLFASGTAPDLILEYDSVIKNQLYTQKQLLPLDEYIEKSTVYKGMLEKYPTLRKLGTKDDGKLYEIGRISDVIPQHIIYIRTDWLKKLNLEMPKTTEDFFNVAKAFADGDPDGNNKKDTYGANLSFVGMMGVDAMFGTIFNANDKNPWILDENENLVLGWDRVEAALQFKKRLYDAGIVDKDFLTDGKGDKAKLDFTTGKLGIWGSNGPDAAAYSTLKQNIPDAEIAALQLPEGPFGSFSPIIGTPISMNAVVNAQAKNPADIIKYIDFMMSEKATMVLNNGMEGEHYKIGDNGCPTVIDPEKNKIEKNYSGDFAMITGGITGKCASYNLLLNPIEPKEQTAEGKAAYEISKQFAAAYQSAFDAYLDPSRPMVSIIPNAALPSLPQTLQINQTNGFKTVYDIIAKSIISGGSYTAQQAIKDAQAAWQTSNGAKVEAFMKEWYAENKDKTLLTKDYYDFIKKNNE